jgi:hypothetical protein
MKMIQATRVNRTKMVRKMATVMSSQRKSLYWMSNWSVERLHRVNSEAMRRRIHCIGRSEAAKIRERQICIVWLALLISFSSIQAQFVDQLRQTLLQHKNRRQWRQQLNRLLALSELFSVKSANLLECWHGNSLVQQRAIIKTMI